MDFDPLYTAGIQKAINEKAKQTLTPDGQFGAKSVAALKVFQKQSNIPATGVYDAATFALLDGFIREKYITLASIQSAAKALGVLPAHIRTICSVESAGSGFLPGGKATILFERQHFLVALKKKFTAAKIAEWTVANGDIINPVRGGYLGGEAEYTRFNRAFRIDSESAIYGTSFGMFQVMGFNYVSAGYTSLTRYYSDMIASETKQLIAFVAFLETYKGGKCLTALKAQDWATFALNYNGNDYKANNYDTKLAAAFSKYSKNIAAY